MPSYRLACTDPRRLRFLLDALPRDFVKQLQAAVGQAVAPCGRFARAHLRRRDDGSWCVAMQFDGGELAALLAPGGELAALLAPWLALPEHPAPPADLHDHDRPATGTVIR